LCEPSQKNGWLPLRPLMHIHPLCFAAYTLTAIGSLSSFLTILTMRGCVWKEVE
jgi:hypothetical protein